MGAELLRVFSSITNAASLLGTACLAVSVLVSLVLILFSHPRRHAIQFVGATAVIGLSLAANSTWVYAIAVFIVATLVTEVEFLEKLAALAWNRKDYWDFRAATDREQRLKREQELREDLPRNVLRESGTMGLAQRHNTGSGILRTASPLAPSEIARITQFEERALRAFATLPVLTGATILTHVRVSNVRRRDATQIIDALVTLKDIRIVVEVKAYTNRNSLAVGVRDVRSATLHFSEVMAQRGEAATLIPLLIVPASLVPPTAIGEVSILGFDPDTNEFRNLEALVDRVEADRPEIDLD